MFLSRTSLCATIFFVIAHASVSTLGAQDTLAADETAVRYRTGSPDERAIQVPGELQQSVFKDPVRFLPELVAHLTRDTTDPFVKAKRIHDWITDNIAYDTDLLLGLSDEGSRKVHELIPLRRTTCGGFGGTFAEMARLAGLEVQTVTGNSRTCWIKKAGRDCRHVWNAVRIGGKWYVIDSTADGRMSFKFGKFSAKRRYSDKNLFLHPAAKLLVNFPLKDDQQFVDPRLTREEFERKPRVSLVYFKYRMKYTAESAARFTTARRDFEGGALEKLFDEAKSDEPVFEVRLDSPEDLLFFPQLVKEPAESFDDAADAAGRQKSNAEDAEPEIDLGAYAFCNREKAIVCQFSPPQPGVYKAYIHVKRPGDATGFELVHAFTLKSTKPGHILPEKPGVLYENAMFRKMRARILSADFQPASGFPHIEIERPADAFLSSFLYDSSGRQIPAAVEVSFPSAEKRKFFYKYPAAGTYFIRLFTRTPNKEGAPRQNIALVRVEVPRATDPVFPAPNELIFTKFFPESKSVLLESRIRPESHSVLRIRSDAALQCSLTNLKTNKQVEFGCVTHKAGAEHTFYFRAPEDGNFSAAVSELDVPEGGQRRTLARFRLEKGGGGPVLPIAGRLFVHSQMEEEKISVQSENTKAGDGDIEIRLRVPAGSQLEGRLLDGAGKAVAKAVTVETSGDTSVLRFRIPKGGSYAAKISVRSGGKSRLVAVFRVDR